MNNQIRIVRYERIEHGEETGNLWFDGLWEMMTPFHRSTMLHYKVLAVAISVWALHIAWLLSKNPTSWSLRFWFWCSIVPLLFLLAQIGWFVLIRVICYGLNNREIRIDDAPQGKDPPPEWEDHWVALQPLSSETKVIGCVTLSRKPSISSENSDETHDKMQMKTSSTSLSIWWLSHLTVATEYRTQGLASRLVDLVETKAKEQGAKRISILVGNMNSRAFWYKNGYIVTGVKWKVLGHESIFMDKSLT